MSRQENQLIKNETSRSSHFALDGSIVLMVTAGSYKLIPLTQNKVAIVDDEDYEELSKYKWRAQWNSYTRSYVAVRSEKRRTILMHRIIMNTPLEMGTDHQNHRTLDNRKKNLRICTNSQNSANGRKQRSYQGKATTSHFKGVSWHKHVKKWVARIIKNGKFYHLGYRHSEIECAQLYDAAAKELFGEFALTNF